MQRLILVLMSLLVLGFSSVGCRIRPRDLGARPSLGQGAGGPPPGSLTETAIARSAKQGPLVPTRFDAPAAIQAEARVYGADDRALRADLAQQQAIYQKTQAKAQQSGKDDAAVQVSKICPGLDTQVNDALASTEKGERVSKFISLSQRCPNSALVWYWLAKSHADSGDYVRAERAVQQSLILDNFNTQARALLDEVKAKQSEGTAKSNLKTGETEK